MTRQLLVDLSKLQLLTAVAVLVAAFSQANALSFYHAALVGQYWALTSTSLNAALGSDYRLLDLDDKRTLSELDIWDMVAIKTRHLGYVINFILIAVFQMRQNLKLWNEWDPFESGKCLRTNDSSSWVAVWFFYAGLLMTLVTLVISLLRPGRRLLDQASDKMKVPTRWLGTCCMDYLDDFRNSTNIWDRIGIVLMILPTCFVLLLYGALLQFVATWTASDAFRILDIVVYIAFSIWATWNIVDIKSSSKPLLVESESSWGFGQVLAVLMLLGLVVSSFGAAKGVFKPRGKD